MNTPNIQNIITFFLKTLQGLKTQNIVLTNNKVQILTDNPMETLSILKEFIIEDYNPYHNNEVKNILINNNMLTYVLN